MVFDSRARTRTVTASVQQPLWLNRSDMREKEEVNYGSAFVRTKISCLAKLPYVRFDAALERKNESYSASHYKIAFQLTFNRCFNVSVEQKKTKKIKSSIHNSINLEKIKKRWIYETKQNKKVRVWARNVRGAHRHPRNPLWRISQNIVCITSLRVLIAHNDTDADNDGGKKLLPSISKQSQTFIDPLML